MFTHQGRYTFNKLANSKNAFGIMYIWSIEIESLGLVCGVSFIVLSSGLADR